MKTYNQCGFLVLLASILTSNATGAGYPGKKGNKKMKTKQERKNEKKTGK